MNTEHVCTVECTYPPTFYNFVSALEFIAQEFGFTLNLQIERDEEGDFSVLAQGSLYSVAYSAEADCLELEWFDPEDEDIDILHTFTAPEAANCAGDFLGMMVAEQVDHLADAIADVINGDGE